MSSKAVREISQQLTDLGLKYGEDFNEYSYLLKDYFKTKFRKNNLNLDDSTYEFTKSIFSKLDIENQSSVLGSWFFLSLICETKTLEGAIVELGVYKGGNAYNACLYKATINDNRMYYLVDSFSGFNNYSLINPAQLKDMFKDNSYRDIMNLFSAFQNSKVIKGFIPEVLSNFIETKFSIIYYDCDTYESCRESLNNLYPKLQPNGYFIIHDYEAKSEGFTGVKKAVDEYLKNLKSNEVSILNIPETTHIILKKL